MLEILDSPLENDNRPLNSDNWREIRFQLTKKMMIKRIGMQLLVVFFLVLIEYFILSEVAGAEITWGILFYLSILTINDGYNSSLKFHPVKNTKNLSLGLIMVLMMVGYFITVYFNVSNIAFHFGIEELSVWQITAFLFLLLSEVVYNFFHFRVYFNEKGMKQVLINNKQALNEFLMEQKSEE